MTGASRSTARSRAGRSARPDLAEYLQRILTAKVYDVLMAVPRLGRVKSTRLLTQCRISQSKTVGGLSDRQRGELLDLFPS